MNRFAEFFRRSRGRDSLVLIFPEQTEPTPKDLVCFDDQELILIERMLREGRGPLNEEEMVAALRFRAHQEHCIDCSIKAEEFIRNR